MAEKRTGKQMTINLLASVVSFGVNMIINFFLTPYLVKELGSESYGFIGLANNFVQYGSIITMALNSMSGRFISIAYHKGDKEKASKIFSSVLVANLCLAVGLVVLSVSLIGYLEYFINIPKEMIASVKVTFALTFVSFVLSVITAVFTTAAFVKNRIDINSVRDIFSNCIKLGIVGFLFAVFPPKLYYLALATVISGIFLLIVNITVRKKILPDVEINIRKFEWGLVKTILAAGVWMSFAQLSNVLITELDLLVCNLTLGAALMGLLSIARTIPHCISSLIAAMASVFTPHYTVLYVKKDWKGLVEEVGRSSRILSLILTVPIAGFIVFGKEFYTLWQPSKTPEEVAMIQILSVLTCLMYLFSAHTQCMTMLNSVFNKMKVPVFVAFGIGLGSIIAIVAILNFCDIGDAGVYVIAGVSSLLMSLRALFFVPLYSAHLLQQRWYTFYPSIVRGWVLFGILAGGFAYIKQFVVINSWKNLILVCLVAGMIGYGVSALVLFKKSELGKLKVLVFKKKG